LDEPGYLVCWRHQNLEDVYMFHVSLEDAIDFACITLEMDEIQFGKELLRG